MLHRSLSTKNISLIARVSLQSRSAFNLVLESKRLIDTHVLQATDPSMNKFSKNYMALVIRFSEFIQKLLYYTRPVSRMTSIRADIRLAVLLVLTALVSALPVLSGTLGTSPPSAVPNGPLPTLTSRYLVTVPHVDESVPDI